MKVYLQFFRALCCTLSLTFCQELIIKTASHQEEHILPGQVTYHQAKIMAAPFDLDQIRQLIHYGEYVKTGAAIYQVQSKTFIQSLIKTIQEYAIQKEQLEQSLNQLTLSNNLFQLGAISKQAYLEMQTKAHQDQQSMNEKQQILITLLTYIQLDISDTLTWPLGDYEALTNEISKHSIKITAPCKGVLAPVKQKPESYSQGEALSSILQLESMIIEAVADEEVVNLILPGQTAQIEIKSIGKSYDGVVKQVHNLPHTLHPTKTYIVEVQPMQSMISIGAVSAHTSIKTSLNDRVYIPIQYTQKIDQSYYVYLKDQSGIKIHPVTLGETSLSKVHVIEGLKTGDIIVPPN
jgi:hypothetical protein